MATSWVPFSLDGDEMFAGEVPEIAGHRISEISAELHHYLEWRAGQEGQVFDLSEAFFTDALHRGVRKFFGVEIGSRGIATDTKRFDLWMCWLQR
jgi:hypothetical protein